MVNHRPLLRKIISNLSEIRFPFLLAVALLSVTVLGVWVRYQFFLIHGGLEDSYIEWAKINYFGGISPIYLQGMEDLLNLSWSTNKYPPGYSLFLTFWTLLGADDPQSLRIAQSIFDSFTIFPLYYILRQIKVHYGIALLCTGIYAIAPLWSFGSIMILAESVSPSLIVWMLALMLFSKNQNKIWLWFLLGLWVSLSTLVRPDLILLIIPLSIWTVLVTIKNSRIKSLSALCIGFSSLLLLWGFYNKIKWGYWQFTSNAGRYAMWCGLGQLPNDYGYFVSDAKAVELLSKKGIIYHSIEAEQYWKAEYLNAWKEHPLYVLKTIWFRLSNIPFDHNSSHTPLGTDYFQIVASLLTEYGFWLLCLVVIVLVLWKQWTTAYITALPLVYCLGSLGLVYYESRYIRYVPLSYVFALALTLNFLLNCGIKLIHTQFLSQYKKIISLAITTSILLILGNYVIDDVKALAELGQAYIKAEQLQQSVIADKVKAFDTLETLDWQKATTSPNLSFTENEVDHLLIQSDLNKYEYQLISSIDTSSLSVIYINYDVELKEGSGSFSILSEKKDLVLAHAILQQGENIRTNDNPWIVPIADNQELYLLFNNGEEPGKSELLVKQVDVYGK
ncbi:MAG: glycosyltransferase family 39 protein [Symploca sp. SIO2C1]|nr:glycosyltransferase family 39 protein [Symploca sp. SIO2C1]